MSNTADQNEGFTENLTETDGFITRGVSSSFDDPLEEYQMNENRRGLALIFNQWDFTSDLDLKLRRGSEADRLVLEPCLKHLGFEVTTYTDLDKSEVNAKLLEAANADHSDADCFLLVFMTHGDGNHVYASDDKLTIKEITDKFNGANCSSLVGKPKIFIWQACRGTERDKPVIACDATSTGTIEVDARAVNTLPAAADFIMCYSVAEGYCSYRHVILGSFYIQDLCELLQKYGDSLEFTQLLTLVNAKVSKRDGIIELENGKRIKIKQISCFASMLTKKLYFKKKAV